MISQYKYILIYITNIVLLFSGSAELGEAYELFLQGEYEMLQNNFEKAEKYFSKALSLSPDSPTILQSLADLKSYQGENVKAIIYLEQIFELEPNNKKNGIILYELLIQEGNPERAKSVLDNLIAYHPRDPDILFSRVNTQFSNQDWKNLLITYRDIYLIDRDKDNLIIKIYEVGVATGNIDLVRKILLELKIGSNKNIILELLISIAENMSQYDEAINLMEELIDKNGITHELRINISELHLKAEQFQEVIDILNPLYEKGYFSLNILRMLLISYSMLEKYEKEIELGKMLVLKYPDLAIGYEALSVSYLQSESNEAAIEILLRALSKFPNEVTFPFMLATILSRIGDYDKAENYFRHALSIQPDYFYVKHSMALMYEKMNNTDKSDSLFLQMIQENKNDAVGQNDYAYILSERKKTSVKNLIYAQQLAENAIALEPNNAAFLDTLGWIYYKLGTYQKAEEYLQKSLSINDHNPVILEHLGDIYLKLNKSIEALEMYQKVLIINSDNQLVKDKINKIYE